MTKHKVTVDLANRDIIKRRAAEEGLTMGAYLDRLAERDDLERRIEADREHKRAAGFDTPERRGMHAAIAAHWVAGRSAATP